MSLLAKSVVLTFMTRAVTTLSGVVVMIAAARLLGPVGKGEYTYLITVVALGTQFGALGVGTANLYYSSRDPAAIGKLLLISARVAASVAVVYCLLLGVLSASGFRLALFDPIDIVLISCAVAVGLLWLHGQNLLIGVGEVARFNVLAITYSAVALLGTVAAFWYLPGSIRAIVTASIVSGVAVVASLWIHVTRKLGQTAQFDSELARMVLRYGFTVYIAQALSFFLIKVDLLLVQYYLESFELGLYSAAGDFSQAIVQLQAVINLLIFPRLATLASEIERREVTRRTVWKALLFYAVFIALIVFFADDLVQGIFGAEFARTADLLIWLLPGTAALAIASILQNHIGAAGRPKDMAFAPGVALVVQITLCALLIPRFGIVGAAMSSFVAFVAMSGTAAFKAFRA